MTVLLWIGGVWLGANALVIALGYLAARASLSSDERRAAEVRQLEALFALPSPKGSDR